MSTGSNCIRDFYFHKDTVVLFSEDENVYSEWLHGYRVRCAVKFKTFSLFMKDIHYSDILYQKYL